MAGFGEGIKKKLITLFESVREEYQLPSSLEMLEFTEKITDLTLSKDLSYKILDAIAREDNSEILELVLREYKNRCIVFSVALREYPELFNRRIYIPIRSSAEDMVFSILGSLRIANNEDFFLILGGVRYTLSSGEKIRDLSVFDMRGDNISLVYGNDSWTFDIQALGLTYYRDSESDLPYLVEDAVGYGIIGMKKSRLFEMLDDSKELSTDTKNPIMDDEEFEFYNADTDELNDEATEEFAKLKAVYSGEENE